MTVIKGIEEKNKMDAEEEFDKMQNKDKIME